MASHTHSLAHAWERLSLGVEVTPYSRAEYAQEEILKSLSNRVWVMNARFRADRWRTLGGRVDGIGRGEKQWQS